MADVVRALSRVEMHREPDVRVVEGAGQRSAGRHHADHDVRLVEHVNNTADDVGITAVSTPPQTVAQNSCAAAVGRVLSRRESAPEPRRDAEHRHQRRRHIHFAHAFSVVVTG